MSTSTATAYKYSVAGHLTFGAPKCEKAQKSSGFWANRTYWLCIKDNVLIEPCCGSGHILVYVFDLLYKMYEEKGYQPREIPTFILSKNLYGLDVDKRAAQLSSFALIMKARVANNRFFTDRYYVSPNVFEIIDSSYLLQMQYRKHLSELNLLSDKETKEIDNLVDLFKNGKTIGSLLKIKGVDLSVVKDVLAKIESNAVSNIFNSLVLTDGVRELKNLFDLAKVLSSKYDVMITNPPYISVSSMESPVKEYAYKHYPDSKADMYGMFMETNFCKKYGLLSMVNMHGWMSLASFEGLRDKLISTKSVLSLVHLGTRAFEAISGEVVQTVTFVMRSDSSIERGTYIDLTDSSDKESDFLSIGNNQLKTHKYIRSMSAFGKVPGTMFTSYWAPEAALKCCNNKQLADYFTTREGMATAGNDEFLRMWYEVCFGRISFLINNSDEGIKKSIKWVPYNKGGGTRDWYGNNDYVVNWENDGQEIRNNKDPDTGRIRSHNYNGTYGFLEGATWSAISSDDISVRYCEKGFLFDSKGAKGFCRSHEELLWTIGLLNSKVASLFLRFLSPTLDFKVGDIIKIPFINEESERPIIIDLVRNLIDYSKVDWDSFETSWDFLEHPLVRWSKGLWDATAIGATMFHFYDDHPKVNSPLELCYMLWQGECKERFDKLKNNEEELNRIFIDIYGLQDELTPKVEDKDITVRLADKERDIKSLISYLVGIIMSRYSLSREGLQYAGGKWDVLKYGEPLDDDGIIPIYTSLGMEDSLTTKIIELIKTIFGEEDYRNNIDFIADALGKKSNESSEETLNRYLNEGFYNDHLKIYQKRPIYWMFSSGKNSGFNCLIYMHRYNADTLARINGKYFLPESTRIKNELDEINTSISTAEGRDRIRLEKERQKLAAKYNEAIEYGQVLDHMANKFIDIDLDDGVKVNYAKFQGIELVTDNGTKVKKDLLVPIK